MNQNSAIFDRNLLRRRKAKAAARFHAHDFLFREAAARLCDRLDDIVRSFPTALVLNSGGLLETLDKQKYGITSLFYGEFIPPTNLSPTPTILCDEERLPFAEESLDLILCLMNLHWINDLPGTLIQLRRALKPDGLLLAIFPGGDTLHELRHVLSDAELEIAGGISPHISPFVDVRDAGSLLQRAGFALPVVDSERLTVSYKTMLHLMHDLRGMGESNALLTQNKKPLLRQTLMRATALYQERYSDSENRLSATFELLTLTAWKPHVSQQQPARRGSGKVSLVERLK